ncbi:hypothetical protein C1M51_02980 [Methylibium sp. Pch-M]|uniref:GIY-YIG nuclease family protein n=1 Tax=Methylibium sp. Pch-M TaxID=2082386 RepID=UPI0010120F29|nr:GIY-YIG nuclease family protein [Methylibium sp. Pch-M]QAZ38469.1 hypothetical protein C1M51_02980 [Methylibium sp. Pch-M]
MNESTTALYRHFDGGDVLLYVGISLSPIYRLSSHRSGSSWAEKIARVSIEWFQTRAEALQAEAYAIATERPAHNVMGRARRGVLVAPPAPKPREPHYVDRAEAVATHFAVSLQTIARLIAEGMPREQVSAKRWRYELGACQDWLRARSEALTFAKITSKLKAAHDAQVIARAAMAEAMESAIATIGEKQA